MVYSKLQQYGNNNKKVLITNRKWFKGIASFFSVVTCIYFYVNISIIIKFYNTIQRVIGLLFPFLP